MESKTDFGSVSVADVMNAIEKTYFQAGEEGRREIAYLMGYIGSDLGVDGSVWLRSVHARLDKEEIEESE